MNKFTNIPTKKREFTQKKKEDFSIPQLSTKKKSHWKLKLYFIMSLLFTVLAVTISLIVIEFINTHTFKWQSPILLQQPLIIERTNIQIISPLASESAMIKKQESLHLVEKAYAEELKKTTDLDIARYIKTKKWDYSIAIRLAKSENFWNQTKSFDCSRTNANDNGTFDVGIFQINSIHAKEVEAEYNMPFVLAMTDCYRNIDFAYKKYTQRSWSPWNAYLNGSYLNHDIIEL